MGLARALAKTAKVVVMMFAFVAYMSYIVVKVAFVTAKTMYIITRDVMREIEVKIREAEQVAETRN